MPQKMLTSIYSAANPMTAKLRPVLLNNFSMQSAAYLMKSKEVNMSGCFPTQGCICAHCKPARFNQAISNVMNINDENTKRKKSLEEIVLELKSELSLLKNRHNKLRQAYNYLEDKVKKLSK